jgi:peptidoglycan glycosyltransferase
VVARQAAEASLEHGRERLLAGDADAASEAFTRAARWPGAAARSRAGADLASARAGREPARPVRLSLLPVPGEAVVLGALDAGRLDAAAAVARLMRLSGDPLGALYEAAVAFETGDEARARAAAGASPTPLAARGPGARLLRALAAREAGARTLVLDRAGELVATLDAAGSLWPEPEAASLACGVLERLPPLHGTGAVRLALDLELSRIALAAIGAWRGTIVIVDPHTGAVRAAVSDAVTAAREAAPPFTQRREPASIAKLLTAAAAYRKGTDPDAAIARMTCTGVERYGGQQLWCPYPSGPLSGLDQALAQSCNVAFASVAVGLGGEAIQDEYRRWGFDAPADAPLGAAGRIHTPPLTPRELADLAIGLTLVDVTPLHAALLAAVVANDGILADPRLVEGAAVSSREVLAPPVAARLRRAMDAVVRYGTGVGLAPDGLAMAMKTGTAAEPGVGYHVNYVGFLPGRSLAFCVRVTHERTSPAVTRAAREVTQRLLRSLADRLQRDRPSPPPALD